LRIFTKLAALCAVAGLLAACSGSGGSSFLGTTPQTNGAGHATLTAAQKGLWPRPGPAVRVCGKPAAGFAACASWIRTDISNAATPSGYGPSDLQTAYGLTTASGSNGSGVTVAIVDAYDDPNAQSDLNVYRSTYGLPACGSGCFTKVKYGKRTNTGWAEEESLDVDMVSAICPKCNILLVEAASNSTANLTTAEQYALAHANYVSNSWSGNEGSTSSDSSYSRSGAVVTAATGDSGYNTTAQWPAIIPAVVGVGGTTLSSTNPRVETAWSGAGSGCSKVYAKPSYQSGINTGCSMRAQADVSAEGDPNTGVAVYDTFHESGWLVFGGTSVATPIIASVYALSGNTDSQSTLYANIDKGLYDPSSGSNGSCGAPLCTSGTGWDGPTGAGSPSGLTAF